MNFSGVPSLRFVSKWVISSDFLFNQGPCWYRVTLLTSSSDTSGLFQMSPCQSLSYIAVQTFMGSRSLPCNSISRCFLAFSIPCGTNCFFEMCSFPRLAARVRVRMDVFPEDLKQMPIATETMASEWPSSIGLRSPHGWVRVRRDVVPEDLKQPPIGAKSMASNLPYPLGQLWDYLAQVDVT